MNNTPAAPADLIVMIGYGPNDTVRVRVYRAADLHRIDQIDFPYDGHSIAVADYFVRKGIVLDRSTRGDLGGSYRYEATYRDRR